MLGAFDYRRSIHLFCGSLAVLILLTWAGETGAQWARSLRVSRQTDQDTTRIFPSGDIPLPTIGITVAERGGTMRLDFKETIRTFRDRVDVASGRVLLRGPDTPVADLVVYFAYVQPEGKRVPVAFDTTDAAGRYHLVAPNSTDLRYEIMTKPIVLETTSASDAEVSAQPEPLQLRRP